MYNLWLIKNCAFEFLDMEISEGEKQEMHYNGKGSD